MSASVDLMPAENSYEQALVKNPLANFVDTDPCICGSGHIWRRCHKSSMIEKVPIEQAEQIEKFLEKWKKVAK